MEKNFCNADVFDRKVHVWRKCKYCEDPMKRNGLCIKHNKCIDKNKNTLKGNSVLENIKEDVANECSICLADFPKGTKGTVSLGCRHDFCYECIHKWLSHGTNTCPNCRTMIPDHVVRVLNPYQSLDRFFSSRAYNGCLFPINGLSVNKMNVMVNSLRTAIEVCQHMTDTDIFPTDNTWYLYNLTYAHIKFPMDWSKDKIVKYLQSIQYDMERAITEYNAITSPINELVNMYNQRHITFVDNFG